MGFCDDPPLVANRIRFPLPPSRNTRAPKSSRQKRPPGTQLGAQELEMRCVLSVTGYSPIDEVGNNVANPDWGAAPADLPGGAAIQLLRLFPVAYADGISTPSLPGNGATVTTPAVPIPCPRTVSNDVFNQSPTLFGSPSTDVNTVNGTGCPTSATPSASSWTTTWTSPRTRPGSRSFPNPNKDGNDFQHPRR